jgi:chromosome segregation ATPase
VQDNWRGDPSSASTSAPDGSRRMQLEDRLVARVRETDKALREAQGQINALTEELRHAKLQAKALREEARLGANVRLALKDQLRAEKKRSNILEQQVETWKAKISGSAGKQLPPAASAAREEDE